VHERELIDTEDGEATDPPVPQAPGPSSTHVAMWWRLVLGVVVAILGTLLLVKVVGGSSGPRTTTDLSLTSPSVLAQVTGIPASVYDAVGVHSPAVPVVAPMRTHGVALLTERAAGERVPVVLFIGTEYNPFSAAERWPLVAALSRFGRFTTLHDDESSSTDFAPNTPTFSFFDVAYHSDFLSFRAYEVDSDVPGPDGYTKLMRVPPALLAQQHRLDPTMTYPFVDIANQVVAREVGLSPITFVGVSRDQIAGALTDSTNPITRSVVASANYLSAAICLADAERPGDVCRSSGVRAADAALHVAG
jgi:Domain of unknown function (DUF929)